MGASVKAWLDLSNTKPRTLFLTRNKYKLLKQKRLKSLSATLGHFNHTEAFPFKSKEAISISNTYPIHIIQSGRSLKIGPIVGILTVKGRKGFKGNGKNYLDIMKEGQKQGVLVYVFTAEDIDYFNQSTSAYLYSNRTNRWIKRTMPIPDVVYNRVPYRQDERRSSVRYALSYFQNNNIPLFNPYFFNKWSLYNWLKESPKLNKYLPETRTLSKNNLTYLLQKNSILYVKPVHGKAGVGFIKIDKKQTTYLLSYQTKKMTYVKQLKNIHLLWNSIRKIVKNQEYIIQAGISLRTYYDNPFDARLLVQKDEHNEWNVTGIGVRIAGSKSITTHVPRGGSIESADRVFITSFGYDQARRLKYNISELAIETAKFIEKRVGSTLGEMSLDIGIDENGELWIFEANSKPMEFDEPGIRHLSLVRLIKYFKYLSNF